MPTFGKMSRKFWKVYVNRVFWFGGYSIVKHTFGTGEDYQCPLTFYICFIINVYSWKCMISDMVKYMIMTAQ